MGRSPLARNWATSHRCMWVKPPPTREDAASARYAQIARDAVDALQASRATDEQVRWLDWFVKVGLLSNKAAATPVLSERIAAYRQIENSLTLPTTMPGLADEGDAIPQPFLPRGDHTKPASRSRLVTRRC